MFIQKFSNFWKSAALPGVLRTVTCSTVPLKYCTVTCTVYTAHCCSPGDYWGHLPSRTFPLYDDLHHKSCRKQSLCRQMRLSSPLCSGATWVERNQGGLGANCLILATNISGSSPRLCFKSWRTFLYKKILRFSTKALLILAKISYLVSLPPQFGWPNLWDWSQRFNFECLCHSTCRRHSNGQNGACMLNIVSP